MEIVHSFHILKVTERKHVVETHLQSNPAWTDIYFLVHSSLEI